MSPTGDRRQGVHARVSDLATEVRETVDTTDWPTVVPGDGDVTVGEFRSQLDQFAATSKPRTIGDGGRDSGVGEREQ